MNKNTPFHGSDIEAVSNFYNIPKETIVCFSSNVNPLGLSDSLKTMLANHLDVLSSYPDRNYSSLKSALSTYCCAPAEYFLVGNGSTEMISVLIQTRRPKKALIISPTYSEYERELSLIGCTLDEYVLRESNDFQLDFDDFIRCMEHGRYELVILCNPNNPTSSALTTVRIRTMLEIIKTYHSFLMIDETYVEFTDNIHEYSAMSLLKEYDNFIVLRGVSKFFAAPGMRFGYAATSNKELHQAFLKLQNPWSLNSLAAFAGEIMFFDTEYIERSKTYLLSEKKRIIDDLSTIPWLKVYPAYANFVLVKVLLPNMTSGHIFHSLIKKGLMVRDCSSFACLDGAYFRFCIMHKEENTRLLKAIHELAKS